MNSLETLYSERQTRLSLKEDHANESPLMKNFLELLVTKKYAYNFDWLGIPIIQIPQDIMALQELIWKTKPDIIIETGIAHGGSLILSASILHLLNGNGKVIGIDIDIRHHNKVNIENHPLAFRIELIEGSSIEDTTIEKIKSLISDSSKVMVILDSNHTHDHVLEELFLYSPFVTKDCYLVVMDTAIQDIPEKYFENRPWGKDNNPKTAVEEFLKIFHTSFEIDTTIENKLLITACPSGYLKCIK
jgi:cephalosporin hydroxylase